MRFRAAIVAVLVLAACTPQARDDVTREAARRVVRPVVAEQFPGVPVEPSVDCIIANAGSTELLSLAADVVTGPTASSAQIVTTIASRPEALRCLATQGLPALLR